MDNDVLQKLAGINLLEDAIASTGHEMGECYILPTAKFQFGLEGKSKQRALSRYGSNCISHLARAIPEMKEIDWNPDLDSLEAMAGIPGIDQQDAVLAASCVANDCALLTTGDKRFMGGLSSHMSLLSIHASLKGRLLCLEQLEVDPENWNSL